MKFTVIEKCFLKATSDARKNCTELIAAMVISISLSLVTIFGNSGMLVAFVKSKSLHSHSNILLAFLCLFDVLVGLTVHPLLIVILAKEDEFALETLVTIFFYLVSLFDGLSIIAITCIALERFTAVCFPFFYSKHATKRNSVAMILLTSAAWILFSFLFFINEVTLLYFCLALELVIFLTVSLCYVYIYVIVQRKRADVIILGTISNGGSTTVLTRNEEGRKSNKIAALLLFFYVCFLPSYIYLVYLLIQGKCDNNLHSSLWLLFLTLANSAGNPLIYYISRADIREEVRRAYRRRPRNVIHPTSSRLGTGTEYENQVRKSQKEIVSVES